MKMWNALCLNQVQWQAFVNIVMEHGSLTNNDLTRTLTTQNEGRNENALARGYLKTGECYENTKRYQSPLGHYAIHQC